VIVDWAVRQVMMYVCFEPTATDAAFNECQLSLFQSGDCERILVVLLGFAKQGDSAK